MGKGTLFRVEKILPQAGLKLGTASAAGQCTELLGLLSGSGIKLNWALHFIKIKIKYE